MPVNSSALIDLNLLGGDPKVPTLVTRQLNICLDVESPFCHSEQAAAAVSAVLDMRVCPCWSLRQARGGHTSLVPSPPSCLAAVEQGGKQGCNLGAARGQAQASPTSPRVG